MNLLSVEIAAGSKERLKELYRTAFPQLEVWEEQKKAEAIKQLREWTSQPPIEISPILQSKASQPMPTVSIPQTLRIWRKS